MNEITLTVEEFVTCLQVKGPFDSGYVYGRHVELIKSHPDYNKWFFLIPSDCSDGFHVISKCGKERREKNERERQEQLAEEWRRRNPPPPTKQELARSLSLQLRKAIDERDTAKIKELRDKLKPLLMP